jgi:phosphate transport system ATP-binding protein
MDIQTNALSLSYRGQKAVRNVHLSVPARSVTALVGPSGSGKSSLLGIFNRTCDLSPDARVLGEAHVLGEDVVKPSTNVRALRRAVGMVFQKPTPFPLSIRRNVTLALEELGTSRSESDRQAEHWLQEVGLWSEVRTRADRSALELSGGQQQRLCIARALALRPRILLLDEPCSALDPISTECIESLLLRLAKSMTIVLVTHNLAQARRIADHVAVLWSDNEGGFLLEQGLREQIFEAPREATTRSYVTGQCC